MASKRMFSEKILESDAFIDMQLQAQALYIHLCMNADDDGFVGSPNKIIRMIGAEKKHYEELINKRFILSFNSGICVIKHWRINNYIPKDRYTETVYREEKAKISIKDNGSYTDRIQNDDSSYTKCIQNDGSSYTQIRLDKNSIDKIRKEEFNTAEISLFFESVWSLYPNKVGKGSVSSKTKKELFNLGYDTISKCIERYVSKKEDWKKWQNGSTFFNSGYIDYLDENYLTNTEVAKPELNEKQEPQSRFSCLTEEEIKGFSDRGAFDLNDESVTYSVLTQEELKYLTEKGVI